MAGRRKAMAVVIGQKVVWHSEEWTVSNVWNTNTEGWRCDLRSAETPGVTASVNVRDLEEVK